MMGIGHNAGAIMVWLEIFHSPKLRPREAAHVSILAQCLVTTHHSSK